VLARCNGVDGLLIRPLAERGHPPNSTFTNFLGVNDNGVAIGFYNDGQNVPHGIVYDYKTETLAIVNDPSGAMGITLNGINDKGQMVGSYTDSKGTRTACSSPASRFKREPGPTSV
jgi:hypothetical protein